MARRGFQVCGVDRSEELLAIARYRVQDAVERREFVTAGLLEASFPSLFDAVLSRGVPIDDRPVVVARKRPKSRGFPVAATA